jgi:hypothetical protein
MIKRIAVWYLVWVGILSGSVLAMEFSADMVSNSQGRSVASKMFFSGDKVRNEMMVSGQQSISIVRMDKKIMWNLMPQQKMYMELKIPQENELGVGKKVKGEVKREKLGREKVNGIDCEKYLITYRSESTGENTKIYQWVSRDQFPIKTAAVDGSWSNEIKNLKKGTQPVNLFEIPAGYKKYAMPMMLQKGKMPADYLKMMKQLPNM